MSGTVNIFLVATPLHYLVSEAIIDCYESGKNNHIFFVRKNIEPLIDRDKWSGMEYLPWPKKEPKKGIFGKMRRIEGNLDKVASVCKDANKIQLHLYVLKSETTNYYINKLITCYPDAQVTVRLLPDGTMNMSKKPMRLVDKLGQYSRKLRWLYSRSLNYYLYDGDRIGSDAPIVDRIYMIEGLPHQYDQERTVEISIASPISSEISGRTSRALVLGQPLFQDKRCRTKAELMALTDGIFKTLKEIGIKEIHYKAHPGDKNGEMFRDEYNNLALEEPLESYLAKNFYNIVIGVTSTALFTAKVIYGSKIRVISYGKDILEGADSRENMRRSGKRFRYAQALRKNMEKMGIEEIDYYPAGIINSHAQIIK